MALVIMIYLALLLGHELALLTTNFIPPKGWGRLVPFRVSGWRGMVYPQRIYNIHWTWGKIDFESYH